MDVIRSAGIRGADAVDPAALKDEEGVTDMRRFLRVLLILAMLGLCMTAEAESAVGLLKIEISRPICGSEPDMPECDIQAREAATQGEPSAWITAWDASGYIPFQGTFEGDETYTAYVTLEAKAGYRFDGNTRVAVYDAESMEYVRTEPLLRQRDRLVIIAEVKAEHYWDEDLGSETDATCISPGSVTRVCKVDPSHVMTEVLPIDPEAHDWGEWETVREATRTREGEKRRACTLCGRVETEAIGKAKLPYTDVYEPDTSWAMAATVAWRAGPDALATATGSQRPATVIVWLDEKLNVYDRDGSLLSDDLGRYIDATSGGMIPAFYIRDSRTAAALKAFLPESGLLDCFVLSTPDHADLVRDVADLTHVRGMLDYTAISKPDRNALTDMVASTNAAHGKVILLSAEAASRENVRFLQSLASTVWAQTPTDTRTIMTMYTNGVNGVVVDDYEAALRAESFFRDDAPSLLRTPLIIGHRGDPSTYVENTLDSARGAFEEGVDSVENDIQLSADGEVFILHDDTTERLLNFIRRDEEGEIYPAEHFTLKQLQAQPFDWESIINWNEVLPGESSRYGTLYGQEEQKTYRIPTLREYIEAFKGTGLVHDTEIKSYNPAIIPAYKALVDDYDAWDQFFTITFNTQILDAIYSDYPQISIGALNLGEWMDVDSEGLEGTNLTQAMLRGLFEVLDAWNATYNPIYMHSHEEALQAARHRGLTVWPWTYRIDYGAENFARDYLRGYAGLTCDYPWVASDYIVEIEARDSVVASIEDIPSPTGRTQSGEERVLADAEPVLLEALPEGQSLVLWRYRAELDVNGTGYGHYYLYSNPFMVSVQPQNPLTFIRQPRDVVVQSGEDVSFSVEVGGGRQPYAYQWQIWDEKRGKWVDLPGFTDSVMSRDDVEKKWNGCRFRCVVADAAGIRIISLEVTLTVRDRIPTGDNSNLPLYLAVAMAALALLILLRRKAEKA